VKSKMWGRSTVVALAWLLVCLTGAPAAAQVSFVGDWTGRYHEDQPDRVPGEEPNNYAGLPVNEAARMYADGWDVERTTVLEHQCQPYTMPYLFHGPLQYRVSEERQPDSQELIAIKYYIGTYQQWRTIWMDGRPHPPEYAPHTFVGFSTRATATRRSGTGWASARDSPTCWPPGFRPTAPTLPRPGCASERASSARASTWRTRRRRRTRPPRSR